MFTQSISGKSQLSGLVQRWGCSYNDILQKKEYDEANRLFNNFLPAQYNITNDGKVRIFKDLYVASNVFLNGSIYKGYWTEIVESRHLHNGEDIYAYDLEQMTGTGIITDIVIDGDLYIGNDATYGYNTNDALTVGTYRKTVFQDTVNGLGTDNLVARSNIYVRGSVYIGFGEEAIPYKNAMEYRDFLIGSCNIMIGSVKTRHLDLSDSNYYIGIGNYQPQHLLDVTGTVRAEAFIGDGSGLTGVTAEAVIPNDLVVNSVTANTFTGGIFVGDGSGLTGINANLPPSGVVAGTYGTTAVVPRITVDAFGLMTNIQNEPIGIDAGAVTTGIFDPLRIPNLSATKITTDQFDPLRIPNLSATKITTDQFDPLRIPNLDASKITTGTFTTARIPNLDASKITTGTFTTARIPNLDASQTTTGTFATARIPNLDASQTTTGTFAIARIPALDASQTTTGTFATARIPDLDASKITTGTFDPQRIADLSITSAKLESNVTVLGNLVTLSNLGIDYAFPQTPLDVHSTTTQTLEFPPLPMNANATTIITAQYGNGAYTASSSTFLNNTYRPYGAFSKSGGSTALGTVWISGTAYDTVSPFNYTGAISTNGVLGEWLQLQLPDLMTLTSFSVQARGSATRGDPNSFTVFGSTDAITWTSLFSTTGETFTSGQVKSYTVTNTVAYRYYRIVVQQLNSSAGWASIAEWRLYGTTESTASTLRVYQDTVYMPYSSLGIGTTAPTEKVDVIGNVKATKFIGEGSSLSNILTTSLNGTITNTQLAGGITSDKFDNTSVSDYVQSTSGWTDSTTNVILTTSTDFVGIGKTNPSEKVDVVGNVKATKFIGEGSSLSNILTTSLNGTITNAQLAGGITSDKLDPSVTGYVTSAGGWTDTGGSVILTTQSELVGIGTTVPLAKTHIYNTGTTTSFRVDDETAPDTTPFIIDAGGNIGIGTVTPLARCHILNELHIESSTLPWNNTAKSGLFMRYSATQGTGYIQSINRSTNTLLSLAIESSTLTCTTQGTNRLHITTGGLVGIGNANPSSKLHVKGQVRVGNDTSWTTGGLRFEDVAGNADAGIAQGNNGLLNFRCPFSDGNNGYQFNNSIGSTALVNITNAGNVGIGTTTPLAELHLQNNNTYETFRIVSKNIENITYVYPPSALTGPITTITNQKYGNGTYTIQGTITTSQFLHDFYKAFDKDDTTRATSCNLTQQDQLAYNYYTYGTAKNITGDTYINGYVGQYLRFTYQPSQDINEKLVVTGFTLTSTFVFYVSNPIPVAPVSFRLFGFINNTWTQLYSKTNEQWSDYNITKTYTFTNTIAYDTYALAVSEMTPNVGNMMMKDMSFIGYPVYNKNISIINNKTLLEVSEGGKVGIGTIEPLAKLHVDNEMHIQASSASWNTTAGKGLYMRYSTFTGQDSAYIQSINRSTGIKSPLRLEASSTTINSDTTILGNTNIVGDTTIQFDKKFSADSPILPTDLALNQGRVSRLNFIGQNTDMLYAVGSLSGAAYNNILSTQNNESTYFTTTISGNNTYIINAITILGGVQKQNSLINLRVVLDMSLAVASFNGCAMIKISHDDSCKVYINNSLQYMCMTPTTNMILVPLTQYMYIECFAYNHQGTQSLSIEIPLNPMFYPYAFP